MDVRLKLKGVYESRRVLASGTRAIYYYLRGFGRLKPLPDDVDEPFHPRSAAFLRAYNAASSAPRRARDLSTLKGLVSDFKASQSWAKLAARTKADYDKHLERIETKWGAYPLDVLEDPKIRVRFLEWRDDMAKRSPRQADSVFAVLRVLLEFGRDRGLILHNHALRPKKVYKADRSDKLWLPEHLERFRAVASPEMRLALELALGTGQRKGDLLKLGWSSYDGDRISFRQGKRRRKIDMRVTAKLKAMLDAEPKRAATILTTSGRPWTVNKTGGSSHFDHKWRKTMLEAGLDGLHFHDIRGTTCTMLAEAGATPSEIAAWLGWTVQTVNTMLDTYQAMTAALSDSAVAKLEARAK